MRVDTTKILTTEEIKTVVAYLKSKRRYINNRQALIVFRLACCCGLRASEVCGLTIDDVRTEGKRPHLRVRKTVGKGGKARKVPLWWDQGTLDDLRACHHPDSAVAVRGLNAPQRRWVIGILSHDS